MNPLARRLRRCVVIAMLLGIAAAIAGMLPGERHWTDSNDCFGIGMSTLLSTEHPRHDACEPKYDKLAGDSPAGGEDLVAYIAIVLAAGVYLYRKPTRKNAFGWSLLSVLGGAAWATASFNLDNMFEHTEMLPAAHVMELTFGAMLLVVIPITFFVAVIGDRWARDEGPRARIVT